jgi:MFS family permease
MRTVEASSTAKDSPNPVTKSWWNRNVAMMSLASFFSDTGHEAATAILPIFLASIGAGAAALGIIEGIADAGSSLLKFLSGNYSDRFGRRKEIIVFGYSLTAIAKAAIGFAMSWSSVFWLRLLAWIGRGSRGPVYDGLLADSVAEKDYGRAFGFQRAMDTLGAVTGPVLALLLVSRVPLREIFLLTFIPGALAVVAITAVRDPKPVLSTMNWHQRLSAMPRPFKGFLLATGIFGLGNFSHTLLILRASELLRPHYGAVTANTTAVGLYTVHNIAYALISFPVGRAGDRFGRGHFLLAGYVLFSLVSLGFGFAHSLGALVVLFVGAGLYVGIVDALEAAYAAELLPREIRNTGFGTLGLVNGIGDFASSAALGVLWSRTSPGVAFTYAAVLAMAGAVLLVLNLPARRI